MPAANVQSAWKHYYCAKKIHAEIKRKRVRHEAFFRVLRKIADGNRVLEIGVGFASCFLIMDRFYDCNPVGIECDEDMLEIALSNVQRIDDRLVSNIIRGSAFFLPFAAQSFEIAYCQGFLEHFEDRQIRCLIDEGLRVAAYFGFSVPTPYFKSTDNLIGDERLLSKQYWRGKVLNDYTVIQDQYYHEREEYFAIVASPV